MIGMNAYDSMVEEEEDALASSREVAAVDARLIVRLLNRRPIVGLLWL